MISYWISSFFKEKAKNKQKKTVKQLKLRVGLIVFWHLGVSFFPQTRFDYLVMKSSRVNITSLFSAGTP